MPPSVVRSPVSGPQALLLAVYSCQPSFERAERHCLDVRDDIVTLDRHGRRNARLLQSLPQRLGGEVQQQRPDDACVDDDGVDSPELPGTHTFVDDLGERLEDVRNVAQRFEVEVRASLGNFTKPDRGEIDRKSTRLNSSHGYISYAV